MAIESQGAPGFDYSAFRRRLDEEDFARQQIAPLKLRLELLDSFLDQHSLAKSGLEAPSFPETKAGRQARTKWEARQARERSVEQSSDKAWDFQPGTLTIVDLSCPFVDESSACALFSICLDVFLDSRKNASRLVVLDEAHKVEAASPTPFVCVIERHG